MKVLNEERVKQRGCDGTGVLELKKDEFLTRGARQYLESIGVPVLQGGAAPSGKGGAKTVAASEGKAKPEHLTHLVGSVLVEKTHPQIALRGKLDSFQAYLLCAQISAKGLGAWELYEELQAVLEYCRNVLIAEVTGKPLAEQTLFGMGEAELRSVSQHPKEHFGVDHRAPEAEMGELCVLLNCLRAQSREIELAAAAAFGMEREDIRKALNRLSSALYILYCKQLARQLELKKE